MKFSIKDYFSKCDRIHSFLLVWSHLLKKSLRKNFIVCRVIVIIIMFDNKDTKTQFNFKATEMAFSKKFRNKILLAKHNFS